MRGYAVYIYVKPTQATRTLYTSSPIGLHLLAFE